MLKVGVDSCAACSCGSIDEHFVNYPLGRASGVTSYVTANKSHTQCVGSKKVQVAFQNEAQAIVSVKMMKPLSKVLFAVSDLVRAHRVVFDLEEHGGSYMEHRATGSKVRIHLERGTHFIYLWYRSHPPSSLRKARDPVAMDVDAIAAQPPVASPAAKDDPFVGREATPP